MLSLEAAQQPWHERSLVAPLLRMTSAADSVRPRRQRKRDVRSTRRRIILTTATRDHDERATVHDEEGRRRVSRRWKRRLPQQLPGELVVDVELVVVRR